MTAPPDDPRLVFMPFDQVVAANGICAIIRDHWWSSDPERGLIFWQTECRREGKLIGASAQCNRDEGTARLLQQRLYPWAELRFEPLVIQPINVSDYA